MSNNKQNKKQSLSDFFSGEPLFKKDWKSILGYILGGIIGFFFFGYAFMPDIFNYDGELLYYFIFFLIFVPAATFIGIKALKYKDNKQFPEFIKNAVGPAPWYWETFPIMKSGSEEYFWKFYGEEEGAKNDENWLVLLASKNEPENIKIALSNYTRAFFVSSSYFGIWFVEKESNEIKLLCFDIDKMDGFGFNQIPENFRKSRKQFFYSLADPIAQLSFSNLSEKGTHKIDFPKEFLAMDELLIVCGCLPDDSNYFNDQNSPAFAIFELHPKEGEIKVMPQHWFNGKNFDLGYQWITRVAKNPADGKIYGDGIRIGPFELSDDGCDLKEWL